MGELGWRCEAEEHQNVGHWNPGIRTWGYWDGGCWGGGTEMEVKD